MSIHGRDIVCVGFADWEAEVWSNQHHLMSRLARDNRVLFVESLGLRQPQLAGRDVRRIWRRLKRGVRPPRAIDGLHVLSPLVIPLHRHRAVRALNSRLLPALVGRGARRLGMKRPVLWAYNPQAEVLVEELDPSLVVYHCVDDIAAQKGVHGESFRETEARFAARADLVLASAPSLFERMQQLSPRALYAPNVADTALFAQALGPGGEDPALAGLPRPRIVFVGAIVGTKIDIGLLAELSELRPDWSLVLVGEVGLGDPGTDVSTLERRPNVHLVGPRSQSALPELLRGADAAIIPYALNELTASIFPMKVYEYLAAGLPVVSTPLPALDGVEDVAFAPDAAATAARLEELMAADGPDERRERSRRASSHSWETRLEEIAAALPT